MNEMAAKLPVAATTAVAWAGTSRRASRSVQTANPAPSAISGASGPSTTPSPSDASAASTIPGSSAGFAGPLADRPCTGTWPPWPGSLVIAAATSTPVSARTGSGHHVGGPSA